MSAKATCPRCHGSGFVDDSRRKISTMERGYIRRRLAMGESAIALAERYGVHKTTIYRIGGMA